MKRKTYILITILSTILILTFFLPIFLSSKPGKNFLISSLEKKLNAKIEIDSLNLNWFGPQLIKNINYKDQNIDLKADLIIFKIPLFSFHKTLNFYKNFKFIAKTHIDNLNINLHFPTYPKVNFYNVYAFIQTTNDISSINIKGKTKENDTEGSFDTAIDIQNDKMKAQITGSNIPTIGFDRLLFYKYKKHQNLLVQLLGSSLNLKIIADLDKLMGPIDIDLSSANSKANLNLFYEKNKITLLDNANITLNLAGINPVFIKNINYLKSQKNHPIILKVDKDGFSLPINPFILKKLKVRQASLDLNRMFVSNTGIIKTVTSITKLKSSNVVDMWFTYINLQIDDGMLYTDRMDILINSYIHMCTWGKINLLDQSLKMYLGIAQNTLENVFGIKNLPNDYVIKIPIKGTLEKPKIDASSATAKILALSTLQSTTSVGSIISGVITQFKNDKDIPSPKTPFPWEGKIQKRKASSSIRLDDIFDFIK